MTVIYVRDRGRVGPLVCQGPYHDEEREGFRCGYEADAKRYVPIFSSAFRYPS